MVQVEGNVLFKYVIKDCLLPAHNDFTMFHHWLIFKNHQLMVHNFDFRPYTAGFFCGCTIKSELSKQIFVEPASVQTVFPVLPLLRHVTSKNCATVSIQRLGKCFQIANNILIEVHFFIMACVGQCYF